MTREEHDEAEFPYPGETVFLAFSEAVASIQKFQVTKADKRSGQLEGTIGISLMSGGEEIHIRVSELSLHGTQVSVSSASRIRTTVWDLGKNRRNIETILEGASKILRSTSPVQSAGGGNSDMTQKGNEAMEELKPLEQLLAQGKISPQEFENAKVRVLATKGNVPCPACGASNPESAGTCFNCGGSIREKFVCPGCGADLPEGDVASCPGCGMKFTGSEKPPEKVYTGFWARLGAAIIDGMLVGIIILLLGAFVSFIFVVPSPSTSSLQDAASASFTFTLVFGFLISWIYYAGQESSTAQATLGKRVIGARVTDLEGKRISFGRASGRWLGKILSAASLGLGFLMIGFSVKKQGLHDKLAGTVVLYREKTG